jgi:enoyl-CoA hydratase/carnithine racemase
MIEAQHLTVERVDSTVILTMRAPERRNALSLALMRELTAVFEELGGDRTVHCVVLAGEGSAFSAGHDLRELRDRDESAYREIFDQCVRLMSVIQEIPQPVIAEIDGVATAAGCQLVATCDLAVASTRATFATPGVRIGLFCSTPMVALSRVVGRKRAMEMLLTGDAIDAGTALHWGLVNRVVAPDELRNATLELASKIARASRSVVQIGKTAFYRQIELEQGAAYAFTKDVMTKNAQTPDAREGITAFIEKRQPRWEE